MKLRHPAIARLLPRFITAGMAAIFGTCRQTVVNQEAKEKLMAEGQPVIFACWHGQLAYFIYNFRGIASSIVLLASASTDGELITRVAQRYGAQVLTGSRQKGGLAALREMTALLRQGKHGGIIADGSRGPCHRLQKGLILLARESGAPVLPMAVASSRKLVLNTWDRFEVILPFSQVALIIGEPFVVPPDSDVKALVACRLVLENRLRDLFVAGQHHSFSEP